MPVDLVGDRSVPDLLRERTERTPGKQWLVDDDGLGRVRSLTYEDFTQAVAKLAGGLAKTGVGRGDSVVVHLDNGCEYVVLLFACAWLGAIAVPSNTANTERELAHVLRACDAQLVVSSLQYAEMVDRARADRPVPGALLTPADEPGWLGYAELAGATAVAPTPVESGAPLEILFTSGTTASPRGVVLTHANWLWSGERTARGLHMDEADRFLTCLPLFHVNAQSLSMLNALTANGTLVLGPKYSASRFVALLRAHRATHTSLVATLVRTLLEQPPSDLDRAHDVRRVSYAINVTDAERASFEERFGMRLVNGYGLSETMTEVCVAPVFGPSRWPSVGLPALGREVRVLTDDGLEAAPGDLGEIVVQGVPGRTIMLGYHDDPDATARTIVDGWLHTGDIGYRDETGYFYFVDRAKDVIKRAGENISASEVEAVIAEHPDVAAVSVVAVPDPLRDEAVKACVILRGNATITAADIQVHCAERLAPFKVPTIVEFWTSFPMTSIGKVQKKALAEGHGSVEPQAPAGPTP